MGEKYNKPKSIVNFIRPTIILMVFRNRQTPLQQMQGQAKYCLLNSSDICNKYLNLMTAEKVPFPCIVS